MSPAIFILTFVAVEVSLALTGTLAVLAHRSRRRQREIRHREQIQHLEAEVRHLQNIIARGEANQRQRRLHNDPTWQKFWTYGIEEGI